MSVTAAGRPHIGRLASQHCVVTGASRGIGAAIAGRLAREGAACTLVARSRAALDDVAAALAAPAHDAHRVRAGDVADRRFWAALAAESPATDVLVNAAGLAQAALLMATQPELVDRLVQTNLMAALWSCQTMARAMARRKKGCIINLSSLLARKGGRGSAVYAASKAGVLGLTRSLAAELGPLNVRVNAILPGYIDSSMTDAMTPDARSRALAAIPLGRFGSVQDVADAALFLVLNEYANNCVLNLDGGLSAT